MANSKVSNPIRYGTKDAEIKFGHLTENNNLLGFIVRSGIHAKHYIAMSNTGNSHLKHGTICRSPGSFQVKAGQNVPDGQPAVYIEAESGDLVIKAAGRVRIEGKNVDIKASGQNGENGTINIDANEKVIINGKQGVFINSDISVKMISENTVECIGKGILNIYGGLIEFADGATSVIGSKPALGTTWEMRNKPLLS
jgi:hypothetical protein